MNYDSLYSYEKDQESKAYIWMICLFVIATIFMIRYVYTNSYYDTGKQSEIIIAEFKVIEIMEEPSLFRVFVVGNFENSIPCSYKPTKKINQSVNLAYRMHEVKTSSGKYKTVPVFDKEISCKTLSGS